MEIRKVGPRPTDHFAAIPNALARDERLSYRARGLMLAIESHSHGFHVTSEELAGRSTEGIKAIRTAMNELIDCGYMRRVRSQDEKGQWRTDIDVYVYGDAPPLKGADTIDDSDFEVRQEVSPTSLFRPSVDGEAVSVHVGEDHLENHSSVSVSDVDVVPTSQVSLLSVEGAATASQDVKPATIPVVLQRKLREMGVTDGTAWTSAWRAANSVDWPDFTPFEAAHFPEEHLMLHLLQQQDRGQTISPSRWLRFFLEDRQRRITIIKADIERDARAAETPQEREDRLNRRLPPIWPDEPAPAPTGERA